MATMGNLAEIDEDPFTAASHHRYSNFDTQLFTLGPTTSPEQAKRALEAHLAETDKRIQDASRLGTSLVRQREELADRLSEVQKQSHESDITPELRQKLVELEKEYNDVGRESARAFLPKSRVSSSEMGTATSPYPIEGKRSISPHKFESQATASPSKLSVPNRKQRNQPSNRVHDIEFATEISTSLLTQVRQLQALLAEKEEAFRAVSAEKLKLELHAESLQQRIKALDESENRYKDENWNLETQIQEFIAKEKAAADREKKLTQSLMVLQATNSTTQRELDEIKVNHANLQEEHAAAVKQYDVELGTVKRNMTLVDNERGALQRKVEELTGQNKELAMGFARQRAMQDEQESQSMTEEDFETADDNITPEHSPPASPVKNTPRHGHLESETLKSSLHHAHRMIQNLKGNIHREKTEKLELKRMLQDARDELEMTRGSLGSGSMRKTRKTDSKEFKKPYRVGQLGGLRQSRSEISMEEADWEDRLDESPSRLGASRLSSMPGGFVESSAETGNETSDAFETANERATDTDFHTGHEGFSESDELTETESGMNTGTVRMRRPPPLSLTTPGNRNSFNSTASLSGDEFSFEDVRTPIQGQNARVRSMRANRESSIRRRRLGSEEPPLLASSPISLGDNSSIRSTPQQGGGQTLFDQLGGMNSDEDESFVEGSSQLLEGTPSRQASVTPAATPSAIPLPPTDVPDTPKTPVPAAPKVAMVDSGSMTEPWAPTPSVAAPAAAAVLGAGGGLAIEHLRNRDSVISEYDDQSDRLSPLSPTDQNRFSMMSNMSGLTTFDEKLAKFPAPPASAGHSPQASISLPTPAPAIELSVSTIQSQDYEPLEPEEEPVTPVQLHFSGVGAADTEPIVPVERPLTPVQLAYSGVGAKTVEPVSPKPATPIALAFSTHNARHVEPQTPVHRPATPPNFSTIQAKHIEPISPEPATQVSLGLSSIDARHVEPVAERPQTPPNVGFSSIETTATEPISPVHKFATPAKMAFSGLGATHVEPMSPEKRPETPVKTPADLGFSEVDARAVEPQSPAAKTPQRLAFSSLESKAAEPVEAVTEQPQLGFSSLESTAAEPIEPVIEPPQLGFSSAKAIDTEPIVPAVTRPTFAFSNVSTHHVEPVAPAERPQTPVTLAFSNFASVDSEPIEVSTPDYKRRGFILAGDVTPPIVTEDPETPKGVVGTVKKFAKEKTPLGMLIAEDETSQPLEQSPKAETPESQRPLKEKSLNTDEKPIRKPKLTMSDGESQTTLTAEEIDHIIARRAKQAAIVDEDSSNPISPPRSTMIPPALKIRKSQESMASVIRIGSGEFERDQEIDLKRPGSAGSRTGSIRGPHPPLPPNHQQAIAAAAQRVGSSSSNAPGLMGPPPLPASAYKTRSRTPASSIGPSSPKADKTPRANFTPGMATTYGTNNTMPVRSRASSVTSFASEVDNRFNLRNGPAEFGISSNTDPRMIQAITQTMIGEYLWKYTRKAGRSEFSDTRHRRYFWVHPYTRTLYWSERDPSVTGKNEVKSKCVAIDAVRVVTDDNPLPPGLHRKSLVILTPGGGRSIKFTAQTGARHETWFNALSYLLLRTDSAVDDTENVAGELTREDVEEFNPQFGRRQSTQRNTAPSLSSYNSRTTRNDSPIRAQSIREAMTPPTLTKSSFSSNTRMSSNTSTFGRLGSYLGRNGNGDSSNGHDNRQANNDTVTSRRSRRSMTSKRAGRASGQDSIYEASEVHDSAEDLRELYERQDRESERLENVRACCDGEHDVGHLSHTPSTGKKSGRSSATPNRSVQGTSQRPGAISRQSIPE